ncbi:MAG: STAS domain-containing protein [Desulfovibrio sp.]|jgi:anti-anti-sigma regulatory factor|nr:STAS domain-containing protein [Desulfovibrio sp.]
MNEFIDSPLLGALARVMVVDISSDFEGVRFPCRPLATYTAERNTALGRFKGQIGLPNLEEFRDALNDLMSKNISRIILDVAAVRLTKSAVGALIAFAAAMHGYNKRLYLYRSSAQLRAVLKELGVTAFFSYLETEDDIIATLVL